VLFKTVLFSNNHYLRDECSVVLIIIVMCMTVHGLPLDW